jgi:hypothetical protein
MNAIYFSFDEVLFLMGLCVVIGFIIRHFEFKHYKKKRDDFRNGYK